MAAIQQTCSVCSDEFEMRFSYQMEECTRTSPDGETQSGFLFFCSQKCLESSHSQDLKGLSQCSACAKHFRLEYAAQVIFISGKRNYACSASCREQLVSESQGARLGDVARQISKPNAPTEPPRAPDAKAPPGPAGVSVTPPRPAGVPVTPPRPAAVPVTPPRPAAVPVTPPRPAAASVTPPGQAAASVTPPGQAGVSVTPPRPAAASVTPPRPAAASDLKPASPSTSADPAKNPPERRAATPQSLLPQAPKKDKKKLPPSRLAVFNHKGGTGKTTTAVTVAAGLADRGYKVLLVDTDAQGNVGVSFGIEPQRTLYHVLVMGLSVKQAAKEVRPGLDVLASNESLAAAELYLAGRKNRDRVLAERLSKAVEHYDFTIIDCSPSLSLMNQNALVVADGVLCPVSCDYLSLVGVRQVLRTLKHVNGLLHHPVEFWGVLPTMFDARAHICHQALDTLREHFGDRCLSPIRAATKVKEAPAHSRTLLEHAPDSKATSGYQELIERLAANRPAQNTLPMASGGLG